MTVVDLSCSLQIQSEDEVLSKFWKCNMCTKIYFYLNAIYLVIFIEYSLSLMSIFI